MLLRNYAVDFVEICNVYIGKMTIKARGVATGGISGYIPPKISPPKIFMGYFSFI